MNAAVLVHDGSRFISIYVVDANIPTGYTQATAKPHVVAGAHDVPLRVDAHARNRRRRILYILDIRNEEQRNVVVGTDNGGQIPKVELEDSVSAGDVQLLRHAGIMTDRGDLLVEHAVNDRYAGARVEVPETDGVVVAARSRDGVPIRQTVHAIGMSI